MLNNVYLRSTFLFLLGVLIVLIATCCKEKLGWHFIILQIREGKEEEGQKMTLGHPSSYYISQETSQKFDPRQAEEKKHDNMLCNMLCWYNMETNNRHVPNSCG